MCWWLITKSGISKEKGIYLFKASDRYCQSVLQKDYANINFHQLRYKLTIIK